MSILDAARARMQRSIDLFGELVTEIPESALRAKLPGLASNTIGQQLWCVVGARESYRRGLTGQWTGFTCSLRWSDCGNRAVILRALSGSGRDILAVLSDAESFVVGQNELMLDLLEHEAAHQGQLIRYLYALDLPIPPGWKERYALG